MGLLAGSALVVGVAPHPAVLVLGLVGLRLAGQGLSGQTALTAMGRYYERGRGRALSVVSLGFPLGEAFLPLLVVGGIGLLGWRPTWGVIAAVVLLGFGPLLIWLLGRSGAEMDPRRARPLDVVAPGPGAGDEHSASGGGRDGADGPAPLVGWGRAKILRDPIFWLALPAALLPPFWITGIFLYQTAIAELKGWPLPLMASAFIAFAATRVVLSLAAGSWIDRVSARRLFPLTPLPLAVGFGLLWVGGAGWIAHAFMGAFGIAAGLSGPVKSALWAELWGLRHLGAVQTMMAAFMVVSTAASPVLVGAALDAGLPLERLLVLGLASVAAGVVLSLPVARADERALHRTGSGSDGYALPMTRYTSKQRAHLRSLAHSLKPILQVGADGVSPAFLESLDEAFNTRELLKVKVLDTSELDARQAADQIAAGLAGVAVVQTIGRTVVLYRPFPKDPEIELP